MREAAPIGARRVTKRRRERTDGGRPFAHRQIPLFRFEPRTASLPSPMEQQQQQQGIHYDNDVCAVGVSV